MTYYDTRVLRNYRQNLPTKIRQHYSQDGLKNTAYKILDGLDVNVLTIKDYKYRIGYFIEFIEANGFNQNSFLDFKRTLATHEYMSVATKNKYLATSRIFLKELYRRSLIPVDITTNIKSFKQSQKHKR